MKRILLVFSLLFSLSFYAQNDKPSDGKTSKIGVVSAEKMNVVYRGIDNPISIYIPNVSTFIASGEGLFKDDKGKYFLNPKEGTEVTISLMYQKNGGYVSEKHKFKILDIPSPNVAFNGGQGYPLCSNCIYEFSKKELKDASLGLLSNREFIYDSDFKVLGMGFTFADDKYIRISGNKINDEAFSEIDKLKKGDTFTIKFSWDANGNVTINPFKIVIKE